VLAGLRRQLERLPQRAGHEALEHLVGRGRERRGLGRGLAGRRGDRRGDVAQAVGARPLEAGQLCRGDELVGLGGGDRLGGGAQRRSERDRRPAAVAADHEPA